MKREWHYLTHEDVRAIHSYLISTFGGLDGLRDEGLFDAAIEQPRQTFGGEDLYPSAAEKAARYAYGIVRNHPFADGNKRTGSACIGMFLRLNEIRFKPRHEDLLQTAIALAEGSMSYEELVSWIEDQI